MANELFSTITELQAFVPGLASTEKLDTMTAAFTFAKSKIIDHITVSVWNEAKAPNAPAEVTESIRMAYGNMAAWQHSIFDNIKKNGTDAKLYKYQFEELRELYIVNFWTGMNNLLEYLDSHDAFGNWGNSTNYQSRQKLIIKSHNDFEHYYAIDRSPYFFSKIIFLIREVTLDRITPLINDLTILEGNVLLCDYVKRGLAYSVMALAVNRFDLNELPKSLRSYITHEYSSVELKMQKREILVVDIGAKAEKYLAKAEAELKRIRKIVTAPVDSSSEEDKFFLS